MTPLLIRKSIPSSDTILAFFKMFGAGIIISTAVIHMFGAAETSLTNPCLPDWFNKYHSWAGSVTLIGMLSACLLQIISSNIVYSAMRNSKAVTYDHNVSLGPTPTGSLSWGEASTQVQERHMHGAMLDQQSSNKVGVYMLETGVAVHSVLVGLSLGGMEKEGFVPMVIALCVHQLFEGMAVSSLVVEAFHRERMVTFALTALYTFSMPVGCAARIIFRDDKLSNSATGLIIQGCLEALAAGILIFDAIANLIVPFFKSAQFMTGTYVFQGVCVFLMWLGAGAMALIGFWA
jgi:zinc transporter 1/2/3